MTEDPIARLSSAVDAGPMMRHRDEFSRWIKLSGTHPTFGRTG